MRIDVLTLFPPLFEILLSQSILKRAIEQKLVKINLVNFRDYARDKHHTVDDSPYGGGPGMVLKPEPIFEAVNDIKVKLDPEDTRRVPVILFSPAGRLFTQEVAGELAKYHHLILICGHYEGVDERVREHLATDEISIGDYVLTGGELPAMVVIDAVTRLVPGVLAETSAVEESHSAGLLEYPQYTRPPNYQGWGIPEVLLSGNHAQIAAWRREQAISRTAERRPDLLEKAVLTDEEQARVAKLLPSKAK